MRFHSQTPNQRKEGLKTAAAYRKVGDTQDIHHNSTLPDCYETWISRSYGGALRNNSLAAVTSSLIVKESPNPSILSAAMATAAATKHAYRFYHLTMRTKGTTNLSGHVGASYASGGTLGFYRHLYFFDCNIGEFKIDIADTNKWLVAWLQTYQTQRSQQLMELKSFAAVRGV